MTLPMTRPWKHPKTGMYWLRKRVPDDLRLLVGKREEKRSLGTRDPDEAKVRLAQAMTEVDARWRNLRAAPKKLTEMEANEIAAPMFDQAVAQFRDNPSDQKFWDVEIGAKLWVVDPLPRLPDDRDAAILMLLSPSDAVLKKQEMQNFCFKLAEQTLLNRGLNVDGNKDKLARAIAHAMQRASIALADLAAGNSPPTGVTLNGLGYPRDQHPQLANVKAVKFQVLYDGWAAEKKPSTKTKYSWKRVVDQLTAYLKHDDAARVSAKDLIEWKASLIADGLKTKTIRDGKLAPIRAILQWGVDNSILPNNAGERVTIDLRTRLVDRKRGYSDEEARKVLAAARKQTDIWLKWTVFVCAYTGARVSEVCQLRAEDILQEDGIWCVRFVPEAGSLKNANSERIVPLHSALVAEGFLEFVESVSSGPLFKDLRPDRFGSRGGSGTKLIGRWVRSLGLTDHRLSPSHSWRHRLRTLGRRFELATDILDAITGHQRRTVADSYGEYPVKSLKRELEKISAIETH